MPLQRYEFSELYGWVEDRYGFSWQLFYADCSDYGDQRILPSLMFGGAQQGQCDQALKFYQALFPDFHPICWCLIQMANLSGKLCIVNLAFAARP